MKTKFVLLVVMLMAAFSAFAADIAPEVPVEPAFEFVKQLLGFLVTTFPKAGPIVQGAFEVIGALASFFTLTAVFIQGVLGIPYLVARWAQADELAEKIKKISEKVTPFFKYLSIFNVQKKK